MTSRWCPRTPGRRVRRNEGSLQRAMITSTRGVGAHLEAAELLGSTASPASWCGASSFRSPTGSDQLAARSQRVLVEQSGELLRREDPVALGHEFTDLLPVRVVGEQHPDATTTGPRDEERVADGQQRLAFVWVRTQ